MKTREVKITDLNEAVYNPRKKLKETDHEFIALKNSIETFGYITPIVVNEHGNVVVSGHQRLYVLEHLGFETVQCVFVDLKEPEEKILNIAMNKVTGSWDEEKLAQLIGELENNEIEVSDFGFNQDELDDLLGRVEVAVEEAEELNAPQENENIVECPRCNHEADKELFKI